MYVSDYNPDAPDRTDLDAASGLTVVEFGADWCGFCQGAQPHIEAALAERQDVLHLKVEDGPGRKLGRTYRVKLWPTLIVLRDGQEVSRTVRPGSAQEVRDALAAAEGQRSE